ncbi:MAG: hypothetical protein M1820_002108 [Bogoriella megaspora]|nr:MAG: hypothetical protein M1820_002108 [Bogoriella megaspora]
MAEGSDQHYDILIVGAGIFGSSTAYHLSVSNTTKQKIVVIDSGPIPPAAAASTDINKILRADYTNELYMRLALEAIEQWRNWEFLEPCYHGSGRVTLNPKGDDFLERTRKNFKAVLGKDPTEDLSLRKLIGSQEEDRILGASAGREEKWRRMFTGTNLEGFDSAYWNPIGGWCDADLATAAMMQEAQKNGVSYIPAAVDKLLLGQDSIRGVKTKDGQEHTANKILLATGAWTSSLMSPIEDTLGMASGDRFERQATAAGVCVLHYRLDSSEMQELSDMPVFIYGMEGEVLPPPGRNRLLKYTNANSFSNHFPTPLGHVISAPPARDQHIVPERLRKETMDIIGNRAMPRYSAGKEPDYWRLCWDAVTPTQDHLISRHPDSRLRNLYFAIGGSFHSYKFLPNIGGYVTKVLNGESNGSEKDKAWMWKTGSDGKIGRGAHEKVVPRRELKDLEEEDTARARL